MIEAARLKGREYIVVNSEEITYQDKKEMAKWPLFRYGRMKGGVIFEKVDKRFDRTVSLIKWGFGMCFTAFIGIFIKLFFG